jgi:hypothetical protein
MKDDMVMSSASIDDDGKSLHLRFVVHNPAGRTRHVYTSIRALRYDKVTKMLEVQMSDHGLMEPRDRRNPAPNDVSPANFILPQMTDVAAGADAEISLHVPRTITRIDANAPPAAVLRLETLQVHEADTVQVDVAWGDTPFYSDPREPFQMRKQLTGWAKGVCRYTIQRNAPPDKPPTGSPNDPPQPPREGPYHGDKQNGRKSPKRNKGAKDKE